MEDTERILIGKADEPTLIAEKLIDTESKTVIFAIGAGTQFAESLTNFKLIRREAQVLKKKVFIESTDERVLKLAEKSGLEIYAGREVPVDADSDVVKVKITTPGKKRVTAANQVVKKVEDDEEEIVGEPVRPTKHRRPMTRAKLIWVIGAAAVIGIGLYFAITVLPKASAELETEKIEWVFKQNIIVDKSISAIDLAQSKVPGQLFIQKDSATLKQPASGTKYIEQHAVGTLTIYNAYSSKAQGLVASTRFSTPGGVVYRLTKAVTVPGANIVDGAIEPSSITAEVTADKAGAVGNSGPVARLTIPGFSGTPKYTKFYGELKEGATGGTVGESKVATAADIAAAKAEASRQIEATLRNQAASQTPSEFKIVESATKFTVLKQDVNAVAASDGNFTVTTQAQLSILGFREKDVLDLLHKRFQKETNSLYEAGVESLVYLTPPSPVPNPLLGKLSLPIDYTATIAQRIDIDGLKHRMMGQSESGIKKIIYSLPGIKGGTVALWPFWVRSVPFDVSKIEVKLQ